jgi:hypothetical protein
MSRFLTRTPGAGHHARMALRGPLTASWLLAVLLLLAASALRCGSASSTVAGPTSNLRCGITITPQTASVGAAGGSGSLTLTTDRECQWAIVLTSNWLSITSSMSGQGPSTISYSATANSSVSPRTAEVAVGDQRVSISQQACTVALSPTSLTIGAAGGETKTAIATDASCSWSVDSAPDWIAPALSSGKGSADLTLLASANQGAQRTGTVVVAGQSVTITQAASATVPPGTCTFTLAPLTFSNVPASGTSLDVTISTQTGCAWTAVTGAPWMSVASGASGTGNGTTRLSVTQNSGGARSGAATVAGRTVTVSQLGSAPTCTYSISSSSFNPSAGGGSTQVTVTTTSGCAWSVSGLPAWISANPANGTDSGNVSLSVQPNASGQRSADLTIAGHAFSVTQAAAAGCSYALDRPSADVPFAQTTTSVTITTTSGCSWSVSGLPAWISANPANGTGPHDVSLTIQANDGVRRSVDLTIAGQKFTVTQSAVVCSYTLNPTSLTDVAATGASASVAITTPSVCDWNVSGLPGWISADPASGTGSGNTLLTIQANLGGQRSADLTIAGQRFTVSQVAVDCSYILNPMEWANVAAAGGSRSVGITAPSSFCGWSVSGLPPWIGASPTSGNGTGSTLLTAQANTTGSPRGVDLTIAGHSFTVTQLGCNYVLNPTGLDVPAAATSRSVTITTTPASGCNWNVTNLPSWITAAPGGGSGTGSTLLTIQANSGGARSVDLMIAGQRFTVSQAAFSCNYVLSPTGLTNVPAAGQTTPVMITTTAGCTWSVTGLPAWISANPTSGTGTGNTSLTIQANSGGARNATITIAGQSFTVTQAAFACSYQLSPTGLTNVSFLGAAQSVTITTTTGCPWSVTGLPPWITALPASGTSSGSTLLTVLPNLGVARNATITIAGQSFTVTQVAHP